MRRVHEGFGLISGNGVNRVPELCKRHGNATIDDGDCSLCGVVESEVDPFFNVRNTFIEELLEVLGCAPNFACQGVERVRRRTS